MLARVPNMLTIFRLILVPLFAVAMAFENFIAAICIYVIASISDVLDGLIARKLNVVSNFGKLMDPAADKLLQAVALVMLAIKGIVYPWLVIVVFVKEILMVIAAAVLYKNKVIVQARWYGKLATVMLFVLVLFMICTNRLFPYLGWQLSFLPIAMDILLGITLISVTGAFVGYLIKYKKELGVALCLDTLSRKKMN